MLSAQCLRLNKASINACIQKDEMIYMKTFYKPNILIKDTKKEKIDSVVYWEYVATYKDAFQAEILTLLFLFRGSSYLSCLAYYLNTTQYSLYRYTIVELNNKSCTIENNMKHLSTNDLVFSSSFVTCYLPTSMFPLSHGCFR